jgi:PilZ domain
MAERRASRRYDLSLSAVVRAPGESDIQQRGKTRDLSTRGVYLVLDRAISRETDVDLSIVLPADMTGGGNVLVRALGKVVRVEEWIQDRTRRFGVAAVLRRYEIIRSDPPPPVPRGF